MARRFRVHWTCRSTVVSSALDVTPSLVNTLCRWYSTVRRLRNSFAAMSGLLSPPLANSAMRTSWGVSWSNVLGSRLRAVSPLARSSARARSVHGAVPSFSKTSRALRRWVRASTRRRCRRSVSPRASSLRARSKGRCAE